MPTCLGVQTSQSGVLRAWLEQYGIFPFLPPPLHTHTHAHTHTHTRTSSWGERKQERFRGFRRASGSVLRGKWQQLKTDSLMREQRGLFPFFQVRSKEVIKLQGRNGCRCVQARMFNQPHEMSNPVLWSGSKRVTQDQKMTFAGNEDHIQSGGQISPQMPKLRSFQEKGILRLSFYHSEGFM